MTDRDKIHNFIFGRAQNNLFDRSSTSPTIMGDDHTMSEVPPKSSGIGDRSSSTLFVTPAPALVARSRPGLGVNTMRKRKPEEGERDSGPKRPRYQATPGLPVPGTEPPEDRKPSFGPGTIIDLEEDDDIVNVDEEEDLYYFENLKIWVPKQEAQSRIRQDLSKSIRKSLNFLPPDAKKRQRLQEIALAIKTSSKKFILRSWKEKGGWESKLEEVQKDVQKEVGEATGIQENIRRPESKRKLQEWVDLLQDKVDQLQRLEELRQKIMTDLTQLADAD